MIREIKFRAWDIREGKMYMNPIVINGRFYTDEYHREIDMSDLDIGKQVLMQFTGLKDKNGKDVYEGDLLKNYLNVVGGGSFIGDIWQVKFGEAEDYDIESGSQWVGFYCENAKGEMSNTYLPTNREDEKTRFGVETGIEIIGNVWENPELLK